jgi:4-amino-4-deoxy-L-arabinose transferase-like glycosyltransferase
MDSQALRRYWPLLALLLGCGLLFFLNLGSPSLWQDEAQTALISRTVLAGGVPRGYDGLNYFSQELGAEYGPNHIWRWHTWLPFYVLAGAFKLFGQSTAVARLPFALCGWLSVGLLYAVCLRLWRSRRDAFVAAALLSLCVQYLLLSRQCRYYSFAAFFSLLAVNCYLLLLDGRGRLGGAGLIASLTLLFHTHYIYCPLVVGAVGLHALLYERRVLGRLALAAGGAGLLCVPWVIWLASMKYPATYRGWLFATSHSLFNLMGFTVPLLLQTFAPEFLFALFSIVAFARLRLGKRPAEAEAPRPGAAPLLWAYVLIHLLALSAISPGPFIRYLAPVFPIVCALLARPVGRAVALHPAVGLVLFGVLALRGPLPDLAYELTHEYNGPITGIVRHLNKEGRPGQLVAITYGDLPLKFYTRMRVIGGLTGEDLSEAARADWVIVRHHLNNEKDRAVAEALQRLVPWDRYRKVEIDAPDAPFENREDLSNHHFRTPTDEPRVVIYERLPGAGPTR